MGKKLYYRETDSRTGKQKWIVVKGAEIYSDGTMITLAYDTIEKDITPFFWKLDLEFKSKAFGMGYFVYKVTRKEDNRSKGDII